MEKLRPLIYLHGKFSRFIGHQSSVLENVAGAKMTRSLPKLSKRAQKNTSHNFGIID
jgi:hypothetical protein